MYRLARTANEAQLKARRTSLGKKSVDELITIILRKDSTERKNNAKIQELQALLKEADELNEEKATRILNFDKDMEGMQDLVAAKQENIDKLISENHSLASQVVEWSKKYVECKSMSKFRRNIMLICFGIIAILIVLFFVL